MVDAHGYQVQVLRYIGAVIILVASLSSLTRCLSKAGPPQMLVNNTGYSAKGVNTEILPGISAISNGAVIPYIGSLGKSYPAFRHSRSTVDRGLSDEAAQLQTSDDD